MALPVGVETVTVTAGEPLSLPDGSLIQGRLIFTGPDLVTIGSDDVVLGGGVEVPLIDGEFSVTLCATDATGMSPTGWTYKVRAQLSNAPDWTRYIALPKATPSVVLADVVVPDPVAGVYTVLLDQGAADARYLQLTGGAVTGALDVAGRLQYAGFRLPHLFSPVRRPQHRAATTSYLMQTGHGWTAGGSGTASSDLNDTTDFVKGTQSIRVTTAANGLQAQLRKTGLSLNLTGKLVRFTFKVDDVTHLSQVRFDVASSSFANFFTWNFHTHSASTSNLVQSGEWVTLTVQWADVNSASGSYSIGATGIPSTKTGFDSIQFAVYDDGIGAVTAHLQSVEIVPDLTNTFANGVISITFDDSYVTQYSLARPKMDALGYRGTVYTIADAIGSNHAVYMNLSELKSLQNFSQWEVAGHAYTGAAHNQVNGYNDATAEQVHVEFTKLKLWLASNGFESENFAYPKGHFEVTTDGVPVDQIAAQYWSTSRTIISETKEAFPVAMPQRIRAKTGISSLGTPVATVAAAGGMLDRCQLSGDWLILCLHKISAGAASSSTEISQADFNTLMDAIASRSIPVLPVREVISYYT